MQIRGAGLRGTIKTNKQKTNKEGSFLAPRTEADSNKHCLGEAEGSLGFGVPGIPWAEAFPDVRCHSNETKLLQESAAKAKCKGKTARLIQVDTVTPEQTIHTLHLNRSL